MPQIRVLWMVLSGIASNHLMTTFFQSRVHIDTYISQAKVSYDLTHFEPTLIFSHGNSVWLMETSINFYTRA